MRRQPVAFFLGDAAFLSDPKFRKLSRLLPDADDFNSAVGAYFVALAAARRNGLPTIDLDLETASRFLPQLIEAQLLTPAGFPEPAFKAWAPSRRPRPSESFGTVVPDAPNVSNGAESVESDASAVSSTPLPSIPFISTGGGPGEGLPHLDSAVAKFWEEATGRSVLSSGPKVAEQLDDFCRRHPPSEVGAAIIRGRKQFDHIPDVRALIGAMLRILDPFVDGKAAAKADHAAEDRAASRRRTEATLSGIHKNGGHELEPRAGCPMCQEAIA